MRRLFVVCCVLFLVGCTSSEERALDYFERAQAYFEAGDLPKAQLEVRNALQINGNLAEARLLYARLLEADQKWREMRGHLEYAIAIDPYLVPAHLKLGMLQVAGQEFDAALRTAEDVIRIDPGNAVAYTLRAATYFYLGETDQSLAAANEALALDAGEVGAISVLTNLLAEAEPLRALDYIDSGLEHKTNHATLLLLRARLLDQSGDLDSALESFDLLLSTYPDEIFFLQQYMDTLVKNERTSLAINRLSEIARTNENIVTRRWLIQLLLQEGQVEEAESLLIGYIANHPDEISYRLMAVQILIGKEEFDEARASLVAWEELSEDESERNEFRNARARLEYFHGDPEKVSSLLASIVESEPANEDALLLRARIATLAGRKEDAAAELRTVLRNNPNSLPAKELLAINHEQQGAEGLAVDLYREVLALDPTNYRALTALGREALANENFGNARRIGETLTKSYPSDFVASQILLTALVSQDDVARAMTEAERVKLNPGSEGIGHYFTGHIQENVGDAQLALTSFRTALEHQPDLVEALSGVVRTLTALGRSQEVRNFLVQHVDEHPTHSHAVIELASAYAREGNVDATLQTLKDGVRKFPQAAQMSIALIDYLLASGDPQQAREVAESARLRHPESPKLLQRLGELALLLEQPRLALQHFEEAFALEANPELRNNIAMLLVDEFPSAENTARALTLVRDLARSDSYAMLDTAGWVYYHVGDQHRALELLERSNRLAEEREPSILYHLGVVEAALGLKRRGQASLEQALAMDVEFAERAAAEVALTLVVGS